ncbi:maleylpyruvate isomerase family mycothiol-dependent enzyme (plasmid) [Streptomyces sp. HUAS TT11]|uniref:maleylpyruvate isomerase family mycothiol-dependent enzyme n=1 Tax=Streptomyces sp. HUAS TT11 TaxID=3447508 RepID=UPI003F65A1E6
MNQIDYKAPAHGGITVEERLKEITAAHVRLRAAAAMPERQAREPIGLPGWTRAHVLIHLADLSGAFARQARYAVQGRTIEVYDGGRPTRDRRIEELHDRPVEWLRHQLTEGLDALELAWAALGPDDWALPCSYRDSPLFATQLAWWRETELHGVDLAVGSTAEEWSLPLARHVVTFLQPRLPENVRIVSEDTGEQWTSGPGTDTTVTADLRTLAAWISGRPASRLPEGELPQLKSWP